MTHNEKKAPKPKITVGGTVVNLGKKTPTRVGTQKGGGKKMSRTLSA